MRTASSAPLKIKIMFVLPGLQPGGAERVMISLMNNLPDDEFEKLMAVCDSSGPLSSLIAHQARFLDLKTPNVYMSFLPLLYAWRREKPDIVMSTMAHMNFIVLLIKMINRKTKVIVREAIVPSYFFNKYKRAKPLIQLAYKTLYRFADMVIAPSEAVLDELTAHANITPEKSFLIFNSVDQKLTEPYIKKAQSNRDQKKDAIHLICSGRLNKQKGFDRLIDLLGTTKLPYKWTLDILGEGEEKVNLQTLIDKNNLKEFVQCKGHIENPCEHYANADYLILPSRSEGMPNVVLESMACGTEVIALEEISGIKDIKGFSHGNGLVTVSGMEGLRQHLLTLEKKEKPYTSLLPEQFSKEYIMINFIKMLKKIHSKFL